MSDNADWGQPRWRVAPYLFVDDVVATANYYRDTLGFGYDRFWGDPPSFCMVRRNAVIIMLKQLDHTGAVRPNRLADPEGDAWDAYIWIDDADALIAEFKAKGVNIVRDVCDQPYGCRDFDVEDCNGYRLCFGFRALTHDGLALLASVAIPLATSQGTEYAGLPQRCMFFTAYDWYGREALK